MLNNIVVGLDGSPSGRRALEWAVDAAAEEVHAVHAVSPAMELFAAGFQIDTRPLVRRLTAKLEGEWTAGLGRDDRKLFTHLVEDSPVLALLGAAGACSAQAIVVGERGHSSASKMVGATTGQLVHLSDFPVIVVPDEADVSNEGDGSGDRQGDTARRADPDVIVVATAGRADEDAELLRWAAAAARSPDTRFELVHGDPQARSTADRLSSWLDDQGLTRPCEVRIERADPITALVGASRHAALLVIGSHRSSRLAAYLSGALANHLPTVSHCPVAVVPLTVPRP